jgi:hypothetical protein
MFLPYAVEDNIERKKNELNVVLNESLNTIAKTSLKHKNLIYVLGWFLNVFDLQYDS